VAASFASRVDSSLAHTPLGPAAREAVTAAKQLALGRADVHGLPPAQAHAVSTAAEAASLHSFHLGMMIAAVLLAAGGAVGVLGIRNVRGAVEAEDCGAGQLVGTGRHLTERSECEQATQLPASVLSRPATGATRAG
jgi:hypothetical protein